MKLEGVATVRNGLTARGARRGPSHHLRLRSQQAFKAR
jgi:hypothetical protein